MNSHKRHCFRIKAAYYLCITVTIVSLTLFTRVAHSEPLLPEFTASYALKKGGIKIGEVKRSLHKSEGNTYQYESLLRSTGLAELIVNETVRETSMWQYAGTNLQPLRYLYLRSGGKHQHRIELTFNWVKNIVTNVINGDPWKMEIPAGAVDKLLYQLAIMHDLARGLTELRYDVADGGLLKTFRFDIIGEETLNTPLGAILTVKIQRNDNKKLTLIWCAKKYHYLPIQIEQNHQERGQLRLTLEMLNGRFH